MKNRTILKLVVCIKQVPMVSELPWDSKSGTLRRDVAEGMMNPACANALETALQIKRRYGGHISVITMGPPMAEEVLYEAIAMGSDSGVLLTDPRMAGGDTYVTSFTLARAIEKVCPDFDLILCGERATDGDTGQVGPGIASFLNLPIATYISKIYDIEEDKKFRVNRLVEGGYEILSLPFPALLTVVKEISFPRLPTLRGKQKAKKVTIPVIVPDDIGAKEDCIGLKGSPTQVVKIFRPQVSRQGEKYTIKEENDIEMAVDRLVEFLQEKQVI